MVSMCASTLKDFHRKCEHSCAELSGAPSAHPSGGKHGFKIKKFKKHWGQSKFSLFGDGLQRIDTGPCDRSRRRSAIVSETTLSQIWHISVKTCRLVETRRKILRFVETRRHILGPAIISTKNAGPEHFGSILVKFQPKFDKILATFHQFGMDSKHLI